ncbi:MAG: M28 family peptidase [Gemmatimonadetes bacterium]|nr:M28 family peptidase [Gemmatimonadota bacterium]
MTRTLPTTARALAALTFALVTALAIAPAAAPAPTLGAQAPSTLGLQKDARIAEAFADVSPARLRALDSTLVAFGTRHTMSDTLSPTRGIGAARRWIHAQLAQYAADCGGCLRVEYDTGSAVITRRRERPTQHLVNVVAWLPGRDTSRVVVIGGHYDSCICSIDNMDATSDAPGADDDGSGTVAVMELARVVSKRFPRGFDATVAFVLYTGEELGLLGSTQFAERLRAQRGEFGEQ